MKLVERSGRPVLVSELLSAVPGLVAGVSTRAFGSTPGAGEAGDGIALLLDALGWSGPPPRFLQQVHGSRILEAGLDESCARGDGLLERRRGRLAGVRVADCLPVVLAPRAGSAVVLLHAGWRGVAAGILEAGVRLLSRASGAAPEAMVAALGPAIGPCCFEVGPEVARSLAPLRPGRVLPGRGDRLLLDLRGAAADRLLDAGLRAAALDAEAPCTRCRADLFHSHRRDGASAGRMAAVAGYRGGR